MLWEPGVGVLEPAAAVELAPGWSSFWQPPSVSHGSPFSGQPAAPCHPLTPPWLCVPPELALAQAEKALLEESGCGKEPRGLRRRKRALAWRPPHHTEAPGAGAQGGPRTMHPSGEPC